MIVYSVGFLCVFLVSTCLGAGHNTFETYPFTLTLTEGYDLYWNVSFAEQTIHFGVKVKTTGWVGFGISPNGLMPGSDVVIGWVDGDKAYFHDRYAEQKSQPPIDKNQDWFLLSGVIHDGYTEMEFSRNFTTCDNESKDLSILADTSRVVYSWNDATPTVTRNDDGTESYSLEPHQTKGSASVNLLGGQPVPPTIPDNAQQFTVGVSNIAVPSDDTTYWCKGVAMSSVISDISTTERYIIRFSPSVSDAASEYIQHMIVYSCDGLSASDLNEGGPCDQQSDALQSCRRDYNTVIASWAIGGTGFTYPEHVAYSIGGPNEHQYFVIVNHYYNPSMKSGIMDSSGITFTYINEKRENNAGVLLMGHGLSITKIIPPKAANYTVRSFCSSTCTNQFIPTDGINIIANTLHLRVSGTGAALSLVRDNGDGTYREANVLEKNLKYDYDLQQYNIIPGEIQVSQSDVLQLNCYYDTSDKDDATFGGDSRYEEACLAFPIYYPRIEMAGCVSLPQFDQLTQFVLTNVPAEQRPLWTALIGNFTETNLDAAVNTLDWTEARVNAIGEAVYVDGKQVGYCYTDSYNVTTTEKFLEISQYYTQPPPVRNCTLRGGGDDGSSANIAHVSTILVLILVIAASLLSF